MKLPDITPAMLTSVAAQVLAVAVAFGAPLNQHQQDSLLALAVLFGTILVGADVKLRRHRLENLPSVTEARKAAKPPAAPVVTWSGGTSAGSPSTATVTYATTVAPKAKPAVKKRPPPKQKPK